MSIWWRQGHIVIRPHLNDRSFFSFEFLLNRCCYSLWYILSKGGFLYLVSKKNALLFLPVSSFELEISEWWVENFVRSFASFELYDRQVTWAGSIKGWGEYTVFILYQCNKQVQIFIKTNFYWSNRNISRNEILLTNLDWSLLFSIQTNKSLSEAPRLNHVC